MSQTIDLGNTESIIFDGKEVLTLKLNDQVIWGYIPANSLVMNCSSTYLEDAGGSTEFSSGYNLHFNINAIEDVVVTFNDFSATIPAGTNQTVKVCDGEAEQQTGDLSIIGQCEFRTIAYSLQVGSGYMYYLPFKLNAVEQWTTTLDYVPDEFLLYSNFDGSRDLKIPDNVKSLGEMAFGGIISADRGYAPFRYSNVYLPKNLEEYFYNSFGLRETLNSTSDGYFYYLDGCPIAPVKLSANMGSEYRFPAETRLLPSTNGYESASYLNFWSSSTYINLYLDETQVKKVPHDCFEGFLYLSVIYLGDKIEYIGDNAFSGCTNLSKFVVKTPADAELTVGATIFGASSKTARSMKVFADHPSILNYDFSGANITPTFYPAYQADWVTLAKPTISLDGAILNITPVEGAEQYEVEYAPLTNFDSFLPTVGQYVPYTTTSATTVDLSSMYSGTEAYYIRVRAISNSAFTSEYSSTARLQRRLAIPDVALDGTTITITPVTNATSYRIFNSSGTLLLDTTDLVVDLSEYQTTSSVSLEIKAYDSTDYYGMSASNYITLPALPAE